MAGFTKKKNKQLAHSESNVLVFKLGRLIVTNSSSIGTKSQMDGNVRVLLTLDVEFSNLAERIRYRSLL